MNPTPFYGSVHSVCQKSGPGLPKFEVEAIHLNEVHPDQLKAVATKVDGQIHRNSGMLVRILRGEKSL